MASTAPRIDDITRPTASAAAGRAGSGTVPVPAGAAGASSARRGSPHATPATIKGDAVLVERLRRGDEAAFLVLVEDHSRSLRRIAQLYATDAVAEEVVQDTWIAVIRGLDRFEGRASLRTWIVKILINIARTRGAREKRQIPFSAFADPAAAPESAVDPDRFQGRAGRFSGGWISFPERWDEQPEERYLSTEGVDVARQAIAALPPAQCEVVTLRDVEGWSSDDVSEALGITPGNQRVLLHRGRSRVRAALERALAETRIRGEVRS
jgi:RNA polymerase sigma-70 factor (ECF subfamily)